MMQSLSRPIRGCRAFVSTFVLAAALSSCYSFGGGGFPSDIKTIYIQAFDNETVQFELDQQLFRKLQERIPRALGIRPAGEQVADAVLRGKIVRYEDAAQNYRPGGSQTGVEVLQHQVQITIAVELINRKNNTVLWESSGLTGRGEYRPQNQTDQEGREKALINLVQQIIDGAQSQW